MQTKIPWLPLARITFSLYDFKNIIHRYETVFIFLQKIKIAFCVRFNLKQIWSGSHLILVQQILNSTISQCYSQRKKKQIVDVHDFGIKTVFLLTSFISSEESQPLLNPYKIIRISCFCSLQFFFIVFFTSDPTFDFCCFIFYQRIV